MASLVATWILAHQGGWDEILMVLAPLLVFAGLLAMARRRVEDLDADGPNGDEGTEDRTPADDPG